MKELLVELVRLEKESLEELRGLRADVRAMTGAALNAEEAAAFLGVSPRILSDLATGGYIPRVRLSEGRYGYRREDLIACMDSRIEKRESAEEWAA